MRVLFVCNMNNHFFSVVRHLRDVGIEAHLLRLKGEPLHFHPSYDTFDLSYQAYTKAAPWGEPSLYSAVAPADIRRFLTRFPFIVGCGPTPAFMEAAGMRLDMFIPHGSDLAEMPFFRPSSPTRGAVSSVVRFPMAQRRGIRHARFNGGAYTPQFEETFAQIGAEGKREAFPIPPVYANDFNADRIDAFYGRSNWYEDFRKIRESNDVIVFHHSRHIWKSRATPISKKGNDKLIRGFAKAVAAHPDVRFGLVMLEYGPDVEPSMQLIRELGIEKNVHSFPLMARRELFVGISLADIVCGEFAISWNFGGTIIEGIAMAKPLLHYRDDSMYPEEERFPVMNVNTDEDIFRALSDYVVRPKHYQAMGREAHAWFKSYIVDRSMREFERVLSY